MVRAHCAPPFAALIASHPQRSVWGPPLKISPLFLYSLWIHTMNRCRSQSFPATASLHRPWRALAATLGTALMLALPPATAQVPSGMGSQRNFPEAALRGNLTINGTSDATLNGSAIRMAPGMRLFSPQNTLVMAHTVLGQNFKVNYLIESSTGMLHAAWILTDAEAAQPRKGGNATTTNITTGSGAVLK